MIHVFLDDARRCPPGFVYARSAEECLLLLKECEVDVLSLDYDLGWGQPSGMDAVCGLIAAGRFPRRIYLHTSSDVGRQRMYQALYAAKPDDVQLFNGPVPAETLREIARVSKP